MSDIDREREKALREAAIAGAGTLAVPDSGRALQPREIKQMLSARLEPELISQLRDLATKRGQSISDIVREALIGLVEDAVTPQVTFMNVELNTPHEFPTTTQFGYWDGHRVQGVDYCRTTLAVRKAG
jgi:hypothetical protein